MIWLGLWILAGALCEVFGHFAPGRRPRLIPLLLTGPFYFIDQTLKGVDGWYFSYQDPRGFWPGFKKEEKPGA